MKTPAGCIRRGLLRANWGSNVPSRKWNCTMDIETREDGDDVVLAQMISEALMTDETIRIPVTEGEPLLTGVRTVTGSIPTRVLALKYKVPYRDALRKVGYQRRPAPARINRLKADLLRKVVDIPTSILVNVRGDDASKFIQTDDNGQMWLVIDLKDDEFAIYVVDGQHRVVALVELCMEDLDRWGDHKLQFVLMLGANEEQEMREFYVVNSTAKSVRTDLALDLLKQQFDADGRVMEQTIETGQKWKVDGQRIMEQLFRTSPVWKGRIRLANEAKGDTIVTAAGFVGSLKQLVTSPFFSALSTDQQVRILDAYWMAVREVVREPFQGDPDSGTSPNDYALLKGVGVMVMHQMLLTVLEHVRSSGGSVFDPAAYQRFVEPVLTRLSGDNQDGEPVEGVDFWLTAPLGGAAGSYSSSAGKRVLIAKLRSLLPTIEIE